jgi:G3E family GTPase
MAGRPTLGDRVPFTLLGGYLGAGKTTLLNRLLATATGRRFVVLVNDIGAVNVDAALVADHAGPTLALTNGCVCCSIGDDLGVTLEQVRALAEPPDQVVMELSGVAEPTRLTPWANTAGFRLDGVVVVADADQIVELAKRRYVGDTIRTQLASADLVVLAKTDLAPDRGAAARTLIGSVTTGAVPVHDGRDLDPTTLFGAGHRVPPGPHDGGRDRHVVTTVPVLMPTRAELVALVEGLAGGVVRAKGVVRCSDVPDPVEVHVVGRRRTVRDRPDLSVASVTDALVVISVPPS